MGPTQYVGIIIKDNKVVDLMSYTSKEETADNLFDSPENKEGTSAEVWGMDSEGNAWKVDMEVQ